MLTSLALVSLIALFLASGRFFVFGQSGLAILALAAYAGLAAGFCLKPRNDAPAGDPFEKTLSFPWLWVAGLAAGCFLAGQGLILLPEAFFKSVKIGLQEKMLAGFSLCLAGAGMLVPYVLRKSQHLTLSLKQTPRWIWFAAGVGFLAWAYAFILVSSTDMGGGQHSFCLFDDAMISLRYAWNLTHGSGLVWNIGERVEGYTNLLMTLYMAIGTWFFDKSGAALFVQVSGLVFLFGAAGLNLPIAGRVFRDIPQDRRVLLLGLILPASLFYYPLTYWSLLGMETGMLCLIVTAATATALTAEAGIAAGAGLGLLAGLLVLVRPDASVQAGVLFLYYALNSWKHPRWLLRMLVTAAIFLVFPLGQLAFRHAYYHAWVPNTYVLKMIGLPVDIRLKGGWGFMKIFLSSVWPALLVALAGLVLRFRKEKFLLLTLLVSVMAYQVYVGGDPWPYWRIMAPYLPMLLMLVMDGLDAAADRLPAAPGWLHRSRATVVWTLTGLLLVLGWANFKYLPEIYFKINPYSVDYNYTNVRVGLRLEKICKPQATVGVFWAGAIPYYSGLKGVDFLGKCDPVIANLKPDLMASGEGMISIPGHNKYSLKYSICQIKPDYIQNYYWRAEDELAFATANYVLNCNMLLLKNSPNIYWERTK